MTHFQAYGTFFRPSWLFLKKQGCPVSYCNAVNLKKKKEKKSRYGCAVVFHLSFQYCLQLSNLLCTPCATISIKCESAQKL